MSDTEMTTNVLQTMVKTVSPLKFVVGYTPKIYITFTPTPTHNKHKPPQIHVKLKLLFLSVSPKPKISDPLLLDLFLQGTIS